MIYFFNTYSNNINLRHSNYLKNKYLLLAEQTENNSTRSQSSLNILENEIGNILNTVMNHITDTNRNNNHDNDDTDTNEDINDDINNENSNENNIDNQFEESKNNESDESTRNRINSNIYTFSLNRNLSNNLSENTSIDDSNNTSENIFSNINRFVRLSPNNITRNYSNSTNSNSNINNLSPLNILGIVSNNTSTERFELPRNVMMSITSTFMNELDSQMQENYQRFMDEINNLDNGESINRNPPISENEFQNIQVNKYVDLKKELDEKNIITNESCSICMENFNDNDDIIKSECEGNHLFHKNCIKPWLLNMSKTCPICRHNMV